ncbi:MAG TPA: hypothetical protein VJN43_01975 [Bryobacteraceae bacterium]|nr:hypothetical protein [Bryobacteraceae bacterium]
MERSYEELERIVREQICKVCADRQADGTCGLEDPKQCALFRLFPEVVEAVRNTTSDDIRDYVNAIRSKVCTVCGEQAPDGSCAARDQVMCALDAYLLLIVDAIEEALGKKFDRPRDLVTWGSPKGNARIEMN